MLPLGCGSDDSAGSDDGDSTTPRPRKTSPRSRTRQGTRGTPNRTSSPDDGGGEAHDDGGEAGPTRIELAYDDGSAEEAFSPWGSETHVLIAVRFTAAGLPGPPGEHEVPGDGRRSRPRRSESGSSAPMERTGCPGHRCSPKAS
ncbi:MAG: hypothetical protein M0C28_11195 [Candidatus Moduliflexus flocculans]|nr:hypothetical protein [Candidatus Moduliflexus flocculans]